MDLEIAGKRALVLASSRGLGRAIATRLAAEGASVLLCGRSEDLLKDAVGAITSTGGKAGYTLVDLFDTDAAAQLHATATEKLGGSPRSWGTTQIPSAGPLPSSSTTHSTVSPSACLA